MRTPLIGRVGRRRSAGLLILLAAASSGCATINGATAGVGAQGQSVLAAANGPARRTGNGRTQTVGLPLPPAAKIGLWTGVAVLLALAMADSDDDASDAGAGAP